MPLLRLLLAAAFSAAFSSSNTASSASKIAGLTYVDVAVWGGSPASITAALAAARAGAKGNISVAVITPDGHIGGLTSSGMGCVDAGNASVIGGLAREFYMRMGEYYGHPGTAAWRLTPAASERMFRRMLDEDNNTILVQGVGHLQSCRVVPAAGTIIQTSASSVPFAAWLWVDGSYEGDLAALCGVPTTFGREANVTYNESLAGVLAEPSAASAGHVQFNVAIDPFESDSGQNSKLLPATGVPPSSLTRQPVPGSADDKVMAYTFRVCITNRSDIRIPFPRPANYSAASWELMLRYINALGSDRVSDYIWRFALPEGKFDVCNYGPLSTHPVGLQWRWPNASAVERISLWNQHKDFVLGALYFLANDPRVPAPLRRDLSRFGLCGDEFPRTGNWPPQLYVREARRVRGDRVFTQHDRTRGLGWAPDSIGLGAFWFDSVVVDRLVYHNKSGRGSPMLLNEGNYNAYSPHTPFDLPYWLLLPPRGAPNVLTPAAPSASHVGFSALRLEPTFMILGQAAGVAAALTVKNRSARIAAHAVDINELQFLLRTQGQRISEGDLGPDDWVPCGVKSKAKLHAHAS